jgi:hypothetical protein
MLAGILLLASPLLTLAAVDGSVQWCEERRARLRVHVSASEYDQAMQLSMALPRDKPLPEACLADKPYAGAASFFLVSDEEPMILLADEPNHADPMEVLASDMWTILTGHDVNVHGFTLDGRFILTWHERSNPRTASSRSTVPGAVRLIPEYTLGTKSMLIVPICPGDYTDAECA